MKFILYISIMFVMIPSGTVSKTAFASLKNHMVSCEFATFNRDVVLVVVDHDQSVPATKQVELKIKLSIGCPNAVGSSS
jgi:hypothetical protein